MTSARLLEPLVLSESVRFPNRMLLAPMEGVTDPVFRGLVLDLRGAGGASTEFVRVSSHAITLRKLEKELGALRDDVPVALQLMAAGTDYLAETIANAEQVGAKWIDLNFGCPVKRVFGRGAGSAVLADPKRLARITAAAVAATKLPVTAKIRVGLTDDSLFHEILDAAGEAGAAMITVHARTRADSYQAPARWEWIAQAASHVHARFPGVPLVGNGSIETADDAHEMMRTTNCDAVMVGRAAIANPFIFNEALGAPLATREQARRFALNYFDAMDPDRALGRFKLLLRSYTAGALFADNRNRLLRVTDPFEMRAAIS
jgi:nifR3 family TIM-barrel protein